MQMSQWRLYAGHCMHPAMAGSVAELVANGMDQCPPGYINLLEYTYSGTALAGLPCSQLDGALFDLPSSGIIDASIYICMSSL